MKSFFNKGANKSWIDYHVSHGLQQNGVCTIRPLAPATHLYCYCKTNGTFCFDMTSRYFSF